MKMLLFLQFSLQLQAIMETDLYFISLDKLLIFMVVSNLLDMVGSLMSKIIKR